MIELYDDNKQVVIDAIEAMIETGGAATERPVGSGKSYIIAEISEYYNNPILLAPRDTILKQHQQIKHYPLVSTYHGLHAMVKSKHSLPKVDLIILDELHRTGSDKYGKSVDALIVANPDAHVFGATATDKRYSDGKEMAKERNLRMVGNMTLEEAVNKGIHKAPTYIVSVYFNKDSYAMSKDLKDRIKKWDNSDELEKLVKDNIGDRTKVIAFFYTKKELKKKRKLITKWLGKEFEYFSITSDNAKYESEVMKQFIEADKAVLCACGMKSEGEHIPGVEAVILMRNTRSKTTYGQQIGRCFKRGQKNSPLIFDFVNNYEKVQLANQDGLSIESSLKANVRKTTGRTTNVIIKSEVLDIMALLKKGKIKEDVNGVISFFKNHPAPEKTVEYRMQRAMLAKIAKKFGTYSPEVQAQLESTMSKRYMSGYKTRYSLLEKAFVYAVSKQRNTDSYYHIKMTNSISLALDDYDNLTYEERYLIDPIRKIGEVTEAIFVDFMQDLQFCKGKTWSKYIKSFSPFGSHAKYINKMLKTPPQEKFSHLYPDHHSLLNITTYFKKGRILTHSRHQWLVRRWRFLNLRDTSLMRTADTEDKLHYDKLKKSLKENYDNNLNDICLASNRTLSKSTWIAQSVYDHLYIIAINPYVGSRDDHLENMFLMVKRYQGLVKLMKPDVLKIASHYYSLMGIILKGLPADSLRIDPKAKRYKHLKDILTVSYTETIFAQINKDPLNALADAMIQRREEDWGVAEAEQGRRQEAERYARNLIVQESHRKKLAKDNYRMWHQNGLKGEAYNNKQIREKKAEEKRRKAVLKKELIAVKPDWLVEVNKREHKKNVLLKRIFKRHNASLMFHLRHSVSFAEWKKTNNITDFDDRPTHEHALELEYWHAINKNGALDRSFEEAYDNLINGEYTLIPEIRLVYWPTSKGVFKWRLRKRREIGYYHCRKDIIASLKVDDVHVWVRQHYVKNGSFVDGKYYQYYPDSIFIPKHKTWSQKRATAKRVEKAKNTRIANKKKQQLIIKNKAEKAAEQKRGAEKWTLLKKKKDQEDRKAAAQGALAKKADKICITTKEKDLRKKWESEVRKREELKDEFLNEIFLKDLVKHRAATYPFDNVWRMRSENMPDLVDIPFDERFKEWKNRSSIISFATRSLKKDNLEFKLWKDLRYSELQNKDKERYDNLINGDPIVNSDHVPKIRVVYWPDNNNNFNWRLRKKVEALVYYCHVQTYLDGKYISDEMRAKPHLFLRKGVDYWDQQQA